MLRQDLQSSRGNVPEGNLSHNRGMILYADPGITGHLASWRDSSMTRPSSFRF
ncbi:hypothetical protein BDZ89DRAFT_1061897 [Hymenopellis radicata]|nr:hypothetical protein BDZ89DRAFT_1061897 [Hymenopellis radicata]